VSGHQTVRKHLGIDKKVAQHSKAIAKMPEEMQELVEQPFYDSGFVTDRNGTVDERMLFFPSRTVRFEKGRDMEELRPMRVVAHVDPEELTGFVRSHKGYFKLSENAEVKPAKVKREKKDSEGKIVEAGEKSFKYAQPVYLYFDIPTGRFEVNADASGIDMEAFSKDFTGDDILKAIDKDTFRFNPVNKFEVKTWTSVPPEGLTQCVLPKDFQTPEGLFLYGSNLKNVQDPVSARLPEEIGCDAVVIEQPSVGYKYWFTRREISVKGFEGTRTGEVIAVQKINGWEIRKCIQAATANLHMSDSDLDRLNKISRRTRDPALFSDRIAAHLKDGDLDKLRETLNSINKLDSKIWRPNLEADLEDILCDRVNRSVDMKYVFDFFDICIRRGFVLEGKKLIEILMKRQKLINVADWALVNGIGRYTVLAQSGLARSVMKTIMKHETISAESDFCKSVVLAADSFKAVKTHTNIFASAKYDCKLELITPETSKILVHAFDDLYSSLEEIEKQYPVIATNDDYLELLRLKPIYATVAGMARSKKQLKNRRDIQAEENTLLFVTALWKRFCSVMDAGLGTSDDDSRIAAIDSIATIKADDRKTLREFAAEYREIARHDVTRRIEKNLRRKWVGAVFALEENGVS
ncbi:MAG: hypothetical protein II518_04410, partial [Candidatus Methanomethylophilus sp.]|nr:hypothetical protein [Methanomethylophilus sp.]